MIVFRGEQPEEAIHSLPGQRQRGDAPLSNPEGSKK